MGGETVGLVGREAELRILADAFRVGPPVVVVSGDAGIGKTRLLREACIRTGETVVGWAAAETVGSPEPYGLLLDLLDSLPSMSELRDESDLRRILNQDTNMEATARQVAARLRGLLATIPCRLLVFEDLHVADELSLSVLAHLAKSSASDDVACWWSLRSDSMPPSSLARLLDLTADVALRVELGPLSPTVAADLARLVNASLAPAEVEDLVAYAEGVPFFIQELARTSRQMRGEMPRALSDAAAMYLDGLDPPSRRVVEMAALFPMRLDAGLLARASGVPHDKVVATFRWGVDNGLLVDSDRHVGFRHALVREAVGQSLISAESEWIHSRIATALEEHAREGGNVPPSLLALQFQQAGDRERATSYSLRAGRIGLKVGALNEARAFFDWVLQANPSGDALCEAELGLAEVLNREGELDAATLRLRRCAALFEATGNQEATGQALVQLAAVHAIFDPRSSVEVLDQVLTMFKDRDQSAVFARAVVTKGYVLTRMLDDSRSGIKYLQEGLILAQQLQSIDLQAIAQEGLSWWYEDQGEPERSELHGEAACELALATEDDALVARTLGARASHLALHGQTKEALRILLVARNRIGLESVHLLQAIDHARCWVYWLAGCPDEADHLAALLESSRFAKIYGRVVRVWAAIEREDTKRAHSILKAWWNELGGDAVRTQVREDMSQIEGEPIQAALAEVLLGAFGDTFDEESLDWARNYDRACRQGRPDSIGLGVTLHARALIRFDRVDSALDVLGVLDQDSDMSLYPLRHGMALELHGEILMRRGTLAEASERFLEAAAVLRGAGNGLDCARCLRRAAESLDAGKQGIPEAKELLTESRSIAVDARAPGEVNRIDRALRARGFRPRAGRPKGSGVADGDLSPREKEVVVLIASGASNAEVGGRLFISEKTVENHVARAQKRLGLSNRASLAAWAAKRGYA